MGKRSNLIGRDGEPIRALTFAGGGFNTVLQLGAAHALLVSRAEAPDVVVGISAGSVNAVALAEILQAGEKAKDPQQRLARRAERFRTIFERYQSTPTELFSALLPDSLEIDTQRPLEPLKLPIHAEQERDERDHALHVRSGLMNVYNELLALGLPIGTIARGVRRYLGLKAIPEERAAGRVIPRLIEESLPFLEMLGANLVRLAPLVPIFLLAAVFPKRKPPAGASAGELVFQARAWEWLKRMLCSALSLAVLVPLWVFVTPISFVLLGFAGGFTVVSVLAKLAVAGWQKWRFTRRIRRRLKALRSKLDKLRRGLGLVRSRPSPWPDRWRSVVQPRLEWLGILRAFAELKKLLGSARKALVSLWSTYVFKKLDGVAGESLRSLHQRALQWRERRKRRHEAAEQQPPEPKSQLPTTAEVWAAVRAWSALFVTLIWRWVLWLIPLGLLRLLLVERSTYWWVFSSLVVIGFCCAGLLYWRRKSLRLNVLRRNALDRALFDPHPVRQLLVRLFDPDYYGALNIDKVVERAMADKTEGYREEPRPYSLARYGRCDPPIRVEVASANVETGEMETLPESTPIVDALLAGLAVVPWFPPQRIGEAFYVDGTNIANEPTRPLFKFLRQKIPQDITRPLPGELNPAASVVHMYTVSPLPISQPELGLRNQNRDGGPDDDSSGDLGVHWPLVDVVERALELQHFRDARLERQLTELHTRAMPAGGGLLFPAPPAFEGDLGKMYLRTRVYPIEPQRPVKVNRRVMRARTEDDRRRIVAETVADGCRAALEAMIQPDIRRSGFGSVRCRKAIESRLSGCSRPTLPGCDSNHGPGLVEVCRHCALTRAEDGTTTKKERCRLVVKPEEQTPPPWPLEGGQSVGPHDKRLSAPKNRQKDTAIDTLKRFKAAGYRVSPKDEPTRWPRDPDPSRPTVSLLFSGGVFRGVYQLGVLNALSDVGLYPDVVAGASIGSITAAMAARVFATTDQDPDKQRELRAERIRRLAAAYMAIDRLVLTDRFSDFVRTMTVRAAQTKFSLRQADQVVRQYDQALSGRYERKARIVLAGLERLFYISPFEFRDLIKALRLRRSDQAIALIKDFFQELLDRGGVGGEVLGSEPLELLIMEHVLDKAGLTEPELRAKPFDHFLSAGIFLLATATNLTRGRLEILGEHQLGDRKRRTSLIQGLLASSAFPGVFRPRWSWEVMPHAANQDLFTDGGVMDNLPLDAVARFLFVAAEAKLIRTRPGTAELPVPHLLFSASLREDPPRLRPTDVEGIAGDWLSLWKRTKRLSYNQKLKIFEYAEQAVRRIWGPAGQAAPDDFEPLDLEVLTVRPRWLCGTFAFHPMLGFRRLFQARSIAHGCASTLIRLDGYRRIPNRERWAGPDGWGVDLERLPKVDRLNGRATFEPQKPTNGRAKGSCWFRPELPCPFSRHSQGTSTKDPHTRFALDRIHQQCGLQETHASKV